MTESSLVKPILRYIIAEYFSLYPTSQHAMYNLMFCGGFRTEWVKNKAGYFELKAYHSTINEDGKLVELDVTTLPVKPINRFEVDNKHFDPTTNDSMHQPTHQANLAFQNMVIDWANEHLDAISDIHFKFYGQELRRFNFYYISSTAAITSMPEDPESIEPEWADAITFHLQDILQRVRSEVSDISDKEVFLQRLKDSNHNAFQTVKLSLEKLELLNSRKVVKQRNKVASQLIKQILAEEKQ